MTHVWFCISCVTPCLPAAGRCALELASAGWRGGGATATTLPAAQSGGCLQGLLWQALQSNTSHQAGRHDSACVHTRRCGSIRQRSRRLQPTRERSAVIVVWVCGVTLDAAQPGLHVCARTHGGARRAHSPAALTRAAQCKCGTQCTEAPSNEKPPSPCMHSPQVHACMHRSALPPDPSSSAAHQQLPQPPITAAGRYTPPTGTCVATLGGTQLSESSRQQRRNYCADSGSCPPHRSARDAAASGRQAPQPPHHAAAAAACSSPQEAATPPAAAAGRVAQRAAAAGQLHSCRGGASHLPAVLAASRGRGRPAAEPLCLLWLTGVDS